MSKFDHVLLVGFGAPSAMGEIQPFLEIVSAGRAIPEERLREVAHHYELIGGRSPYREQTLKLADRLSKALKEIDVSLPVFVGMRNWHPFLKETVADIQAKGLRRGIAVILSPFRSEASCQRYKQNVEDAKLLAGAELIEYDFLEPWFEHPLFIEAQTVKIQECLERFSCDRDTTRFIFTAHSIPKAMNQSCSYCSYEKEFQQSSRLIAAQAGLKDWQCAYQSRSGNPREPWLGPDILEAITLAASEGKKSVMAIPLGFFCENVEILYDLDIEAKQAATGIGMDFVRVPALADQSQFTQMLQKMISEKIRVLEAAALSCGASKAALRVSN